MYIFSHAILKDRNANGRWSEIDASTLTLNHLWNNYAQVFLILTHSVLEETLSLNLIEYRLIAKPEDFTKTVQQFLIDNGNKTLPTTTNIPVINPQYVSYSDAIQAGYKITPVDKTAGYDSSIPDSEKEDLLLTKENLDYTLFDQYGLATVNGFIHLTDSGPNGVHIVDGHTSKRLANDTLVGVWNFQRLGTVKRIPITRESIAEPKGDQRLKDYADVHLEMDVKNKTVFVVIGGYLHTFSSLVRNVGEGIFRIDFSNFPLIERYYESRGFIDLSHLEELMTKKNGNFNQLDLEEIYSDEWLLRYLTLSQSFFIVIDTPTVFVDYSNLEALPSPGRFVSEEFPNFPIQYGTGRFLDYHFSNEYGKWLIAGQVAREPLYNFNTTRWREGISVDNTKSTIRPYLKPNAFFVKIGKDI